MRNSLTSMMRIEVNLSALILSLSLSQAKNARTVEVWYPVWSGKLVLSITTKRYSPSFSMNSGKVVLSYLEFKTQNWGTTFSCYNSFRKADIFSVTNTPSIGSIFGKKFSHFYRFVTV